MCRSERSKLGCGCWRRGDEDNILGCLKASAEECILEWLRARSEENILDIRELITGVKNVIRKVMIYTWHRVLLESWNRGS